MFFRCQEINQMKTEKKRSEQALIQVVQECWLNGVSTRKIEKIAKRLGIESLSASEVSEINNGLDEMVDEFRTRKLEAESRGLILNISTLTSF